jgi:3-phenylpropionate/trans-cinnamate dioxygenase ferredoxin reductase subunit
VLVVGAGRAAAVAAQTLREEGFDGPINLRGEEVHPPYERPLLSKSYLQGHVDRESLLVHPGTWRRTSADSWALPSRSRSACWPTHACR